MSTLYQAFKTACERYSPKTALIDYHSDQSWTYQTLQADVLCLIAGFQRDCGLMLGERVGLLMSNQVEWVQAFFALQALGAIVVPLSYRLTGHELQAIAKDSGFIGLVTSAEYWEHSQAVFSQLKWVVQAETLAAAPTCSLPAFSCQAWQDITTTLQAEPAVIQAQDLAVLIYTSGTTGNAKGVMLSHQNLLADADGNTQVIEATGEDIFVTASPLFHVFGLTNVMLTGLLAGSTLVLIRRFNPKSMLEAISTHHITFLAAVPTMYQMMLSLLPNPAYDLKSLRVCHSGAAPMHEAVFHQVEALFGAPVQEGYGQSEASSIVTSNPLRDTRKPSSIGKAIPGVTVEIVDEAGQVLPPGEIGELRISGNTVMLGYWNRPEATTRALRGGYLYTSDMGSTDEAGYIYLRGRRDDLINVGGTKVYPQEVEEALYRHPAVQHCAVVGEASALYFQIVSAYVVLRDGHQPTSMELQRFCRETLAEHKVPKAMYFVGEIPKGATGKILRHQLQPPGAVPGALG